MYYISYQSEQQTAICDIIVYKEIRNKIACRYNNFKAGPKRSFKWADDLEVYEVGKTHYSELFTFKGFPYRDPDTRENTTRWKPVGITASFEKFKIQYVSYYDVYLCRCRIPKGAKYHVCKDENSCITDTLIIDEVIETITDFRHTM